MPTCALLPAEGVIREGDSSRVEGEKGEEEVGEEKGIDRWADISIYTSIYIYINVHPIHACIHRRNVTQVKFVSGKKKEK